VIATTSILISLVVFLLWAIDFPKRPPLQSILNHFWYFSLLWLFFFPIRAALISEKMIDLQVDRNWVDDQLFFSLLIAFGFWLASYFGYISSRVVSAHLNPIVPVEEKWTQRAWLVSILFLVAAWVFAAINLMQDGALRPFQGNEQNEERTGAGYLFMFSELYLLAFIAYIGTRMNHRRATGWTRAMDLVLIGLVFVTSVILTVGLASRRLVAAVILCLLIVYLAKRGKGAWIALISVAMTSVAAPVVPILRYMEVGAFLSPGARWVSRFSDAFELRFFLTNVSSSFEGIDHLAAFVERASWGSLLLGVDGGIAWLFNTFLGLVPRAIWPDKPELYGSVAEQYFLYPWMYVDGPATTTLPPSYITDFSFGLGILVGLCLAFGLGRLFKALQDYLWDGRYLGPIRAFSLFCFLNMFNVLRGGTGFIQSLIMLLAVMALMFGAVSVRRIVGVAIHDMVGIQRTRGDHSRVAIA